MKRRKREPQMNGMVLWTPKQQRRFREDLAELTRQVESLSAIVVGIAEAFKVFVTDPTIEDLAAVQADGPDGPQGGGR